MALRLIRDVKKSCHSTWTIEKSLGFITYAARKDSIF